MGRRRLSKKLSPIRWAIDITHILNAIPDFKRFPINVVEVAKEISHHKFPQDPITLVKGRDLPGFEGAMTKAPRGKLGWGIFYNSGIRSKGRINFTLAHEFYHYLGHRIEYPKGFMCSTEDMSKWGSQYVQLEAEANEFAANLLMPLDDFRNQIDAAHFPDLEYLSICAERYGVSLIASILRWLSFTSKQAILVISRDEFVLWARSSEAALKSCLYFKTQDRAPVPLPASALACQRGKIVGHSGSVEHAGNVWLKQSCREQVVFSDVYDFTISLLFFEDRDYLSHGFDEMEEDTYDRFNRRAPGQS